METKQDLCCGHGVDGRRRSLVKSALGAVAIGAAGGFSLAWGDLAEAAALTREQRDRLSPDDVIAMLKRGNERFRTGKMEQHDYLAQKRASSNGQYPAAVVLGCIDSRAPAEIILDAGIGDLFIARVAGNVANDDLLGSLEFACAVSGAKLVVVMGHTACGAIKGAIDHAQLGHLTGLLDKIKPAVDATPFDGARDSKNEAFVDAVAKTHVLRTVEGIRRDSSVLAGLEKDGRIKIVGSMYHLIGGRVDFY